MTDVLQLKLEAAKQMQEFSQWMMVAEGALIATFAKWIRSGAITPTASQKVMTLGGFGLAFVCATFRLGFLSDVIQRLDETSFISDMTVSHDPRLEWIVVSLFGVPQHLAFLVGLAGFCWAAWYLRQDKSADAAVDGLND